jgi:peptide/nickel transport system permease protein
LYGGRVSLEVGVGSTALGFLVGGSLGIFAGYRGGFIESVIMRCVDVLIAFPSLVLLIAISEYLGPSEIHVIWAISFFAIPAFTRLARAATLRVRQQTFIAAARLSGTKQRRLLFRHIGPNIFPQLMTFSLLGVSVAILVEATLSFLGFGVPPPGPSWGNMISSGEQYLTSDPYLVLIPAAFLFATVMSLNLLGDALRARWATG